MFAPAAWSSPSIFLSAIKVCRQQIAIIIKVKSNCTIYHILHFHKIVFVCCLLCIKECRQIAISIKPYDDMALAILYIGSPPSRKPQKRAQKLNIVMRIFPTKPNVSFSLLLVGWMKKGPSFAIRCFWYPKKYNICDQLHTPACQNLSHLFRIGRKSVINQTDSVG